MRQDANIRVALVEHAQARSLARAELTDKSVHNARLRLPLRIRDVDNVQQHVGIAQLLKRRLEGFDEVRRQLADEADGVGQQHLLLEILTAADEEDVVFVRVQRLADRAFVDIDLDAAALKAALHGDDVAAVAVQIKDVRVQMADIEFHFSVPPYS